MNQERRAELLEIEATRIADERRRVAATKDRIAALEVELAKVREERDALRAAWECAKRQNAHDMLLSGDEIHQHDATIQQARGAK